MLMLLGAFLLGMVVHHLIGQKIADKLKDLLK